MKADTAEWSASRIGSTYNPGDPLSLVGYRTRGYCWLGCIICFDSLHLSFWLRDLVLNCAKAEHSAWIGHYRAQTAARRRAVGDAGADVVGVRLNARGSLDLSMTSSPAVADCQSAFNFLTRIGVQLLDAKIALLGSLLQAIYTPNSDVGAFVHLPTLLGSKVSVPGEPHGRQ